MVLYMLTKVYSEENCIANHAKELDAFDKKSGTLADMLANREYILFDRVEENPSVETVMTAQFHAHIAQLLGTVEVPERSSKPARSFCSVTLPS